MRSSVLVFAVCLLSQITACAVNKDVAARLYNLETAEVLHATFNFRGKTSGTIRFTLPSGEHFEGEYQTLRGGSEAWGSVYSAVCTPSGAILGRTTTATVNVRPDEYVGAAIATSKQGRIIECEYITNRSRRTPHGQGACKDNKGNLYRLMF